MPLQVSASCIHLPCTIAPPPPLQVRRRGAMRLQRRQVRSAAKVLWRWLPQQDVCTHPGIGQVRAMAEDSPAGPAAGGGAIGRPRPEVRTTAAAVMLRLCCGYAVAMLYGLAMRPHSSAVSTMRPFKQLPCAPALRHIAVPARLQRGPAQHCSCKAQQLADSQQPIKCSPNIPALLRLGCY